jgi:prepilin-type N-terminal cleavage/methylation domain-containing protein
MAPRGNHAFTALELVVAVVLVAILTALAVRPGMAFLARIKMNNAVNAVKQVIINARSQAVANPMLHCGVAVKIHSGTVADSILSFFDKSVPPNNLYNPGADPLYQRPYALRPADGVQIISAAPGTILFRGDGSANMSAKIVLKFRQMEDTLDILASTGRVKVIRH